jgi:sugar (pentulose or hexulose) kinase
VLWERALAYPGRFEDPHSWQKALAQLVAAIPLPWRRRVGAIAIDGTSGTLLLGRPDGTLLEGPLALAIPYHRACPTHQAVAAALVGGHGPAASASGSLARALALLSLAEQAAIQPPLILRHQADWLMGWLLGDWHWGEEGNNLRLGWDLQQEAWSGTLAQQNWASYLPTILASGTRVGPLAAEAAAALDLPAQCQVVAGSTDANAGVLAAAAGPHDGITILGTTLVLKQVVPKPLEGPGISCHRLAGRWLVGGASNVGAGVLARLFSDDQIASLSRQMDPDRPTGLVLRPLLGTGERFPVDDPNLEPLLEPRPVGDALYLQALLEGITAVEQAGWQRLRELGAPPVHRVITLGGGARNPQWRSLRQRALGIPVLNRPGLTAAQGMARLALAALEGAPAPKPPAAEPAA